MHVLSVKVTAQIVTHEGKSEHKLLPVIPVKDCRQLLFCHTLVHDPTARLQASSPVQVVPC